MNETLILLGMLALLAGAIVASALIVKRAVVALRFVPPRRVILPMSTGVPILPTQSAQITGRPQCDEFRPLRLYISGVGTQGGAADWIVNDIKIGNQSQFVQSGDVPGDMFASNTIDDASASFDVAKSNMDVVLVITYIGDKKEGAPFFASFIGEGVGLTRDRYVKAQLRLVPDGQKKVAA